MLDGDGASVTGGNRRRVQKRKPPRGYFTPEKRQTFLDHVAACCNVKAAAEAAGVGVSTVYDARRRDPEFAGAFAEAIEAGYATLETLLVERAATGGSYAPGETPVPGPETIDTMLALDLLRLNRRDKAPRSLGGAPPRRASEKALAEEILARIEAIEKKRARKGRGKTDPRLRRGADENAETGGRSVNRRDPPDPLTPTLSPPGRGSVSPGR